LPHGDRALGVRVTYQREDKFTPGDDADVQEAKSLARAHRANRYGLYSAVLARLLLLVFASRAIFELVNGNVITAIVVALLAVASVWYADWASRRGRPAAGRGP